MIEKLVLQSIIDAVNEYASYESYAARHQSDRDVPNISVFIKGISKVETFKARETHARLFALYLCLLKSHFIERILNGKKYVAGLPPHQSHNATVPLV